MRSLVMYAEPEQLRKAAQWDGAQGQSRKKLVARLQGTKQAGRPSC